MHRAATVQFGGLNMPRTAPRLYDTSECLAAIRKQMAWMKKHYELAQPICYFLADEHLSPYRTEDLQKDVSKAELEQFGFEQYIGKSVVHWMLSNRLPVAMIQRYLADEQAAPALEVMESRIELRRAVQRARIPRKNPIFHYHVPDERGRYP